MRRLIWTMAFVVVISAGCGGSSTKTSSSTIAPASSGATSTRAATPSKSSNPKADGYACSLLSKDEIAAEAGGPTKDLTHVTATLGPGEAVTDCTAESVMVCPDNLPDNSPYCTGAYRVDWTVDVFDDPVKAKANFAHTKQAEGVASAVPIAGADEAFGGANDPRFFNLIKGGTVVSVTYLPSGTLSGNPKVLPRSAPSQLPGLMKFSQIIASRLP